MTYKSFLKRKTTFQNVIFENIFNIKKENALLRDILFLLSSSFNAILSNLNFYKKFIFIIFALLKL